MIEGYWLTIKDGDPRGLWLFNRHYSKHHYKDNRVVRRFCGPGEHMVLLTADCLALWVWRKFMRPSLDGQAGVACSIFRNEGPILSSTLIREACDLAERRWPGERQFTYVDPRKIRSSNPGACFKFAGFRQCGLTKVNKLLIFERLPV